jgi:uncharacterized protein YbjT (DUF2867 family)
MNRILITGATGNVGTEVIKALKSLNGSHPIYAGVRDVAAANHLPEGVIPVRFDFEDAAAQQQALQNFDVLFLLRPPQLADVKKYFAPLIQMAKAAPVRHIVFLSVQGAEDNRFIPHYKIEKAIQASGIPYTFLRPAYFMQNFTTMLRRDLIDKKQIFLPAGNARFALVDVTDIGSVAAHVLTRPEEHRNKAYDLTADEKLTYGEMAAILSKVLQIPIRYVSPGLLQFYRSKRKEGFAIGYILVLIMLHYLPRFQKSPPVSQSIREISGRAPTSFREFVEQNKAQLLA